MRFETIPCLLGCLPVTSVMWLGKVLLGKGGINPWAFTPSLMYSSKCGVFVLSLLSHLNRSYEISWTVLSYLFLSYFNNLSELEITFITNDGYLFDFNGSEHSFAIEITEIIDKFEYINPRYGNIEI